MVDISSKEQQGDRNANPNSWGIYDRLKKVPPLPLPSSRSGGRAAPAGLPPVGGRKTDLAAEAAARRMVEDHFKNEDDIADPLADFVHIDSNEYLHRGRQKLPREEDIAVCSCEYVDGDVEESACGRNCLNVQNSIECRASHCPCGEQCRNQKFQRNEYAATKLVKTASRGWGLATEQDLKAGDFVIEYVGEVIPRKEAYVRMKAYEASGLKDSYIVAVGPSDHVDATRKGNLSRFINHSCEPNCEIRRWTVLGDVRIGIFTTVDIDDGTELTYNYLKSLWFGGNSKVECACGAETCVGILEVTYKFLERDAFAWEDDTEGHEEEELQISAPEDYTPLFAKRSTPFKTLQGVGSTSARGGGVSEVVAKAEKDSTNSNVPATSMARENASQAVGGGGEEVAPAVNGNRAALESRSPSPPVVAKRGRPAVIRRGGDSSSVAQQKMLAAAVVGRLRDGPPDTRSSSSRKGNSSIQAATTAATTATKLPARPNALEEEEIKLAKKRARSNMEAAAAAASAAADGGGGGGPMAAASAERRLSDNLSRVAAFRRVRNVLNKQMMEQSFNCHPIPEAACAEVEFAQQMDMGAESDLKRARDDIAPALREALKSGQEAPPVAVQKWTEARCKKLHRSLEFHFSIVKHLAGPTYTSIQAREASTP